MIQLILLIIGIVALFKKNISVTKATELRQPKLRIFGVVTIVMFLLVVLSDVVLPEGTDLGILIYALSFIIPIIIAFKLQQPKASLPEVKESKR